MPDNDIFVAVTALGRIYRKDYGTPTLSDCDAWRQWQREGTAKPERKRRERKPTLAGALKQASKAGAKVRGATVAADGSVSLQFGESQTDQTNDLDKWMAKRYAN